MRVQRILQCEKSANTEFFLVRNYPYLAQIRQNTDHKKLCIWTIFTLLEISLIKLFRCVLG